jgi:phosphotriesterase-related protein
MNRRSFIKLGVSGSMVMHLPASHLLAANNNSLMTVSGKLNPNKAGIVLPHEHILVDFIGADQVNPNRYEREAVFKKALPYLEQAKALGCQTMMECTPNYLGRDPELLKQLSEGTELNLLTNTGYYAARNYQHLPPSFFDTSVEEVAEVWINEWKNGIGDTGIKPGFIKIGNDPGDQIEIDQKLIRVAALTHKATGLTIANHLSKGYAAIEAIQILEIIQEEGIHPSAWIWVHAQNEADMSKHIEVARQGAWIEFDGLSPERIVQHATFVVNMKNEGLLSQVLVSHDAGWYHVGEAEGGDYRGYNTLFDGFIPVLKKQGFTEEEIDVLIVQNPAKAFEVKKRKA